MHFTKADCFLGFFGKFQKRVNRLKNYTAWISLVEILAIQPCQSFCQSIELPIAKSNVRLVYCGNEIRNFFTVFDFDWMASDSPDMSRVTEQFNFSFPLLQKSNELKSSVFFGCCFRFFSVLSLASFGAGIVNNRDNEPTQKSQQNSNFEDWGEHGPLWFKILFYSEAILSGIGIRYLTDAIWPKSDAKNPTPSSREKSPQH